MASLRDILLPNARSALAVDFGTDFVAVRHAPPGAEWVELGAVSVESPDFAAEMIALADVARDITGGDMRAELWLPASQIVNLEIEGQSRLELLARRGAAEHLAEAVGIPAEQLSFDLAAPQADGRRSACATETSTVEEASSHAAAWGFTPTIITTRHAAPAFTRPPRFDGGSSRRAALPVVAVAAAAALFVVASGFWWMEDGPHEPPAVNLETVATAPAPAPEPPLPDVELAVEATDTVAPLVEAPAPSASPEVEVSAPKGSETPLEFSVASDATPLASPDAEEPLAVQDEGRAVAGAVAVVADSITPAESADPLVVRDFIADQTPVAPPVPKLASNDADEITDAALAPDADNPPRGGIAAAAVTGSGPGGQNIVPPIAPLEDRAPPPDTDIASVDPAEFAKEAESWAEAEGAAENEEGAGETDALADETIPAHEGSETLEDIALAEAEGDEGALSEDEAGLDDASELSREPASGDAESDPAQLALLALPTPTFEDRSTPALLESDDFDDIDLGPGPGSVLRAPAPKHRPPELDMTPSELAVLTAPAPGHRPSSIKPKPKPIAPNVRTANAPSRGKPSGPGLSRAATLKDVIPLDDLSLLGTFGQGNKRRALLRMPSGEVMRVSRGDVVEGWVIGKIEVLSMRITRGGEARTLPLAR